MLFVSISNITLIRRLTSKWEN